jgi:glycosyltransferase involved in cell wall biosynthesis
VVVVDPDNAAVELIEEGVNGFVAASVMPSDLAQAILRVQDAGPVLRQSTADWFDRNGASLSLAASLDAVSAAYAASPDG